MTPLARSLKAAVIAFVLLSAGLKTGRIGAPAEETMAQSARAAPGTAMVADGRPAVDAAIDSPEA